MLHALPSPAAPIPRSAPALVQALGRDERELAAALEVGAAGDEEPLLGVLLPHAASPNETARAGTTDLRIGRILAPCSATCQLCS